YQHYGKRIFKITEIILLCSIIAQGNDPPGLRRNDLWDKLDLDMVRSNCLYFVEHDRISFKIEEIDLLHFRLIVKHVAKIDSRRIESKVSYFFCIMVFDAFRIRKVISFQKQRISF